MKPDTTTTGAQATGTQAASTRRWQAANHQLLHLHLQRLRSLLSARALWLRSQWEHDPRLDHASGAIGELHADWLLRGEDAAARETFYATDPRALRRMALADAAAGQAGELEARMETEGSKPPALAVLRRLFRLDAEEVDVLVLLLAPELDPSLPALYAYLQDDMSRANATAALAASVLRYEPAGDGPLAETSTLRRYQLIECHSRASTIHANAPLGLDERIRDYLLGVNRPDTALSGLVTALPDAPVATVLSRQGHDIARSLAIHRTRTGLWRPVNLIGPPDSGQEPLARAICHELGIALFGLQPDALTDTPAVRGLIEREALLLQAGFHVAASAEHRITTLPQAPLFISSRTLLPQPGTMLPVRPVPLDAADRIELWSSALGEEAEQLAGTLPALVQHYGFGPLAVASAAADALARRAGDLLDPTHLWAASRDASGTGLDAVATRVLPGPTRAELILLPAAARQLDELLAQVRNRHTVYADWGLGSNRGRGISALFAGPSGTGKTMAAEVIAGELDLALYRIDLAGLISKYVGETEKNIRMVFEAAAGNGAVLFFDEADAIFGKRTEAKDSHDRYANIEINYLLQCMESHTGLSILATNRRAALDPAFLRRLRFVISFPFPDAPARRRIWQRALPGTVPQEDLDVDALARLEVSGGNITNIAVNAAFLAAERGQPVTTALLFEAARTEYAKIEKIGTEAEFGRYAP